MNEVIENETFQDRAFERESFGRLWKYFFSAAAAIGSVIFLLGLFVGLGFATILILILAIAVGVMGFNVMSAKSRAVAKREVNRSMVLTVTLPDGNGSQKSKMAAEK